MSTEALNRIIKEVNALTPQERRQLIDRLAHEEQNSQVESGEKIFERVPKAAEPQVLFDVESRKLSAAPALADIWGRWPGDESIDELLTALTQ